MLKGKDYRALDKLFPCAVALIGYSIKQKKTAPMIKAYRWYSVMIDEMS